MQGNNSIANIMVGSVHFINRCKPVRAEPLHEYNQAGRRHSRAGLLASNGFCFYKSHQVQTDAVLAAAKQGSGIRRILGLAATGNSFSTFFAVTL